MHENLLTNLVSAIQAVDCLKQDSLSDSKDESLRNWIKKFDEGAFSRTDIHTQCAAGWYDWFCKDHMLRKKLYALAPKVKQIAQSSKVDLDKHYVFFKNNCPMYGNLYDDFRICDLETGAVIYTITPKEGHHSTQKGKASSVWGRDADGEFVCLVQGTWRDVRKFFGV